MLKPDLSTASLHFINTSEFTPHDFKHVFFEDYRICEGTLVFYWTSYYGSLTQCGLYTGSTSAARFANIISQGSPAAKMLLPGIGCRLYLCPASCRFVVIDDTDINRVGVVDLF